MKRNVISFIETSILHYLPAEYEKTNEQVVLKEKLTNRVTTRLSNYYTVLQLFFFLKWDILTHFERLWVIESKSTIHFRHQFQFSGSRNDILHTKKCSCLDNANRKEKKCSFEAYTRFQCEIKKTTSEIKEIRKKYKTIRLRHVHKSPSQIGTNKKKKIHTEVLSKFTGPKNSYLHFLNTGTFLPDVKFCVIHLKRFQFKLLLVHFLKF